MEEKPDSRDSDGSWVLAGSEGLPIDTVGPEPQDSTSQGDEEPEEEEEEEGTQNVTSPRQPQRPESSRDTEECGDPKAGAAPGLDGSTVQDEEEEEEEEADAEAKLGSCPDAPEAGPPMDQGTPNSTDDDDDGDDDGDDITKGLRRRLGHQPHPGHPPPVSVPHRGPQGAGDGDGLNVSRFLLGALALVAVGLLIVSGGFQEAADGPVDTAATRDTGTGEQEPPPPAGAPPPTDGNDSQPPALPQPGDPRSVQTVSVLLDKLAREHQEIRLLQAELQVREHPRRLPAPLLPPRAPKTPPNPLPRRTRRSCASCCRRARAKRRPRARSSRVWPRRTRSSGRRWRGRALPSAVPGPSWPGSGRGGHRAAPRNLQPPGRGDPRARVPEPAVTARRRGKGPGAAAALWLPYGRNWRGSWGEQGARGGLRGWWRSSEPWSSAWPGSWSGRCPNRSGSPGKSRSERRRTGSGTSGTAGGTPPPGSAAKPPAPPRIPGGPGSVKGGKPGGNHPGTPPGRPPLTAPGRPGAARGWPIAPARRGWSPCARSGSCSS